MYILSIQLNNWGHTDKKVKQVDLGISSLNKTDCFILDCGKGHDIFVYMPEGSSRMERFKGTQAANAIRDEDHAGEGTVIQNKFSRSEIKLLHWIYKAFFQKQIWKLIAHPSALEITQLWNVMIIYNLFDRNIIGDQNKLSLVKTLDDCVIFKADVWAIFELNLKMIFQKWIIHFIDSIVYTPILNVFMLPIIFEWNW